MKYNKDMYLIVGLGNIGKEYEKTRHNAGFIAADMLREKLGFSHFEEKPKFHSEISEGEFEGNKIIIARPGLFMNRSGEAVSELVNFYKIPPAHIFVACDDIDIPLGTLRIRKMGSPGTHNGLKSITESLGSGNFARFRIGIGGGKGFEQADLKDYVLAKTPLPEWKTLLKMCGMAAEAIMLALKSGLETAMNRYNKEKKS